MKTKFLKVFFFLIVALIIALAFVGGWTLISSFFGSGSKASSKKMVSASATQSHPISVIDVDAIDEWQSYNMLSAGLDIYNIVDNGNIEFRSIDIWFLKKGDYEATATFTFCKFDFSDENYYFNMRSGYGENEVFDDAMISVSRIFVENSQLVIIQNDGTEFARYSIEGLNHAQANFGGLKAKLAGVVTIRNEYVYDYLDVMTDSLEIRVGAPVWWNNTIYNVELDRNYMYDYWTINGGRFFTIELSETRRLDLLMRPVGSAIGIRVDGARKVGDQWGFSSSLINEISTPDYTWLMPSSIIVYTEGDFLYVTFETDGGTHLYSMSMNGSTTARVIIPQVSDYELSASVSGLPLTQGDFANLTMTLLGVNGEVFRILTLPRNTIIDRDLYSDYRPNIPGLPYYYQYSINVISGNQPNTFLTQNTVWQFVVMDYFNLSFYDSINDIAFPMIYGLYGAAVNASEIPSYSGFVPPLFIFSHWETLSGIALDENFTISGDMTFYPQFKSDYVLETERAPEIIHQANSYTNTEINKHFAPQGYMRSEDATIQSRSNPIALTSLQILNFRYPYGVSTYHYNNDVYFEMILGKGSREILRLRRTSAAVLLELGYGSTWQTLTSIQMSMWQERKTGTDKPTADNPIRWNQFTFEMQSKGVDVSWVLTWGLSDASTNYARNGLLPFCSHILPNSDGQNQPTLGVSNVYLYPYRLSKDADVLDGWREGTILGIPGTGIGYGDKYIHEYLYNYYPGLRFEGYDAIGNHELQLFLEGEYIGTKTVAPHIYTNPEIPAELQRAGYSVAWFIDPQMTIPLERHHTNSMFTALYGRFVAERFEVSLSFYTLTREWVSGASLFYEALTWRTEYRWFNSGEIITTDKFGTTQNGRPFYNRVAGIDFLGWSNGIGKVATQDMQITGNYKLPQITVRYFDINDKLFGDVKSDIEMFPLSLLYDQIQLLELQEGAAPPKSDNAKEWPGLIFGFARLVRVALFGGDDNTFIENAMLREAQIRESRAIVRRMVLEYSGDNQIFFPIVRLDINLEYIDKGNYQNENFYVDPIKNPQWRLLNGTPEANNLIYYVDFHDYFSLTSTHNFTLVVNFYKPIMWYDRIADSIGDFFSSVFGRLFPSLGNWSWLIVIAAICFVVWLLALWLKKGA